MRKGIGETKTARTVAKATAGHPGPGRVAISGATWLRFGGEVAPLASHAERAGIALDVVLARINDSGISVIDALAGKEGA
jgi:hypothetical protein